MLKIIGVLIFLIACPIYAQPSRDTDLKKASSGTANSEVPPLWVDNAAALYPEEDYIACTGTGTSRNEAENNAIEGLAAIFNRSVSSQSNASVNYSSSNAGSGSNTLTKHLQKKTSLSTNIKNLAGVSIKETWKSEDGTCYAVAVLNKSETAALYMKKIKDNNAAIAEITIVPENEKDTLREYMRYYSAYKNAAENADYLSYLAFIKPAASESATAETIPAHQFQLICADIAKKIPIGISVSGDKGGKLSSALSNVFTSEGFITASATEAPYLIKAELTVTDESAKNDKKAILRYTLDISLIESVSNETLLPFSLSGREVHVNKTSAENKIYSALEKKIKTDFTASVTEYLGMPAGK